MNKYQKMDLDHLIQRRHQTVLSERDHRLLHYVNEITHKHNKNNISRTKAYMHYYQKNPEIIWALLASLVSRNAGWNMTDLTLKPYKMLFSKEYLRLLFHSYERPNWLIFSDAYPQLLVYEISKKERKPLFYLLKAFNVSLFMEYKWELFWESKDRWDQCYSQIINEQQIIEGPILNEFFFKKTIYNSFIFHLQEMLHMNAAIFPTCLGELFGLSIHRFNDVDKRIDIGKQLSWLLFKTPESKKIIQFATEVEPTGSRLDYEQFLPKQNIEYISLPLLDLYPSVKHHRSETEEWFNGSFSDNWLTKPNLPNYKLNKWYSRKQAQVKNVSHIFHRIKHPFKQQDTE